MFRGQFIHKISKTGRISVPSKFRENLKKKYKTKNLILSTFENSIICYPYPEWIKLEAKISKLPQFKKETGIQKVQCVILTDGEAGQLPVYKPYTDYRDDEVRLGTRHWNPENSYLRNR